MTRANSKKTKLATARLAKGLTQLQMASKMGFSPSYYAMVEREPSFMSEEFADKAAKILGVQTGAIK